MKSRSLPCCLGTVCMLLEGFVSSMGQVLRDIGSQGGVVGGEGWVGLVEKSLSVNITINVIWGLEVEGS